MINKNLIRDRKIWSLEYESAITKHHIPTNAVKHLLNVPALPSRYASPQSLLTCSGATESSHLVKARLEIDQIRVQAELELKYFWLVVHRA